MSPRKTASNEPDALGSEGWARSWRSEVHQMLAAGDDPARLATFVRLGKRWRVWSLLRRGDGTAFGSLEELCAEDPPSGLGCSISELGSDSKPSTRARAPAASAPAEEAPARPVKRSVPSALVPMRAPTRRKPAAKKPAPKPAAKRPAPKAEPARRVIRRLTMLRSDIAAALARGEFGSVAEAERAGRKRRGPDPIEKILRAVEGLTKADRVRLSLRLVEMGLLRVR